LSGGLVIDVVDLVAAAAAAVTVGEDEFVFGSAEEAGVGAAGFFGADHVVDAGEGVDVAGFGGAEVDEGNDVHVAADVEVAFTVESHSDVVVAVPYELRGETDEVELFVGERADADGHAALAVVEGNVLLLAGGEEIEADGVAGPDGGDVDGLPRGSGGEECQGQAGMEHVGYPSLNVAL